MEVMASSSAVLPVRTAGSLCGASAVSCSYSLDGDGCKVAFKRSGGFDATQRLEATEPDAVRRTSVSASQVAIQALVASSRRAVNAALAASLSLALCFGSGVEVAEARFEGVNKPELLPKDFTPVIDVAGFLSGGQEGRLVEAVNSIEEDTGFKLRVLAQNYPDTPGLAVKDFWKVDDETIVFVADPSLGNILNFNVGATVDLAVPRSFWSRLAGKYGNVFYWRENGEDVSIEAAVTAIGACLREPLGPLACSSIK